MPAFTFIVAATETADALTQHDVMVEALREDPIGREMTNIICALTNTLRDYPVSPTHLLLALDGIAQATLTLSYARPSFPPFAKPAESWDKTLARARNAWAVLKATYETNGE